MSARTGILPRPRYTRDAKFFLVATEGQETEPRYFHALVARELVPPTRVKIHVLPAEEGRSAVVHLVDRVSGFLARERLIDGFDQVWLVLDTDLGIGGRTEQLHALATTCAEQGWNLAVSHPCFEVWLLLHFTDDLSAVTDVCASVTPLLRARLGGYSKTSTPDACLDHSAITAAIERAQKIDPPGPWPVRAATRVYKLVAEARRGWAGR